MKTKANIAVQKFTEGHNRVQAVFYSFCDDFQIDKDIALKTATGFGAGMGRKEEVCGANPRWHTRNRLKIWERSDVPCVKSVVEISDAIL